MDTKERWRPIKGFEGRYEVSSLGRVKSLSRAKHIPNGEVRLSTEKILKLGKNPCGYCLAFLYKNNKRKAAQVHRLVANAFIDNPNGLRQVNHIDGDKTNNAVSNLEWCSCKDNIRHANRVLQRGRGERISQHRRDGSLLRYWSSAGEASEELKISRFHIRLCVNGVRKSAGGFVWKRAV